MPVSPTVLKTVDGTLVRIYPIPASDLFRVIIGDRPFPDLLTEEEIQRLVATGSSRSQPDDDIMAAEWHEDLEVNPTSTKLKNWGHCGFILEKATKPESIIKIVPLADRPLHRIRKQEADPWKSFIGSNILAINYYQAQLFAALSKEPGPASLPIIRSYREGLLDQESLDLLVQILGKRMAHRYFQVGQPVAAWEMEKLTSDPNLSRSQVEKARRQALDYLFKEHGMIARDIADVSNWGLRGGSPVLFDPVVLPISWIRGDTPILSLADARKRIRKVKKRQRSKFISVAGPLGQNLMDGEESLAIVLLALDRAYRIPDAGFYALLDSLRVNVPYARSTYLGWAHDSRPFESE